MKWLVTGIHGFIGSNFAHMLFGMGEDVVGVDKGTYAANPKNIEGLGITVHPVDISNAHDMEQVLYACKHKGGFPDVVVNFAAESHVDRSIESSREFVNTNILGVQVLLDLALKFGFKFVQVSTDEVYGSVEQQDGKHFTEEMRLFTNSPYSASKAAADMLVQSYVRTHGINAIITRCSNNYGPRQHPEKMMPKCILNSLARKEIPVYGDGMNIRDWIHVEDHCRGILLMSSLSENHSGEIFNLGGDNPMTNLKLVGEILKETGGLSESVVMVEDRKGHDRTYAVDHSKATRYGWSPTVDFKQGLKDTIEWYKERRE